MSYSKLEMEQRVGNRLEQVFPLYTQVPYTLTKSPFPDAEDQTSGLVSVWYACYHRANYPPKFNTTDRKVTL